MTVARPLRLLHCHSTFSLGGKEARAAALMNAFGGNASHVVLSAMPDQMGARGAIAGDIDVAFPADAPSLAGVPGPRRYGALARYMQRFDLVLTYNWGAMDAVMAHRALTPLMRLPPLIHHEDGFNADESAGLDWRRNLFRRVALTTARQLVVPSYSLETVARTAWGQRRRVRRIANGIDTARYAAPPLPGALPGFERAPGDYVVGTVAGLRAVKDIPLLIRAIAACPDHVRLVIVGEGPERGAIEQEIGKHGLGHRIVLTGFLADPARYVGLFDSLVLSSLSEQQPIAVIEAMAAGRPIVAPDVGDIARMVSDANRPFIVERSAAALAGAITTLAADAALRDAIGAANRLRAASEFDAIAMIARYAGIYAAAIGVAPERLWRRQTHLASAAFIA